MPRYHLALTMLLLGSINLPLDVKAEDCGKRFTIATHDNSTTFYSMVNVQQSKKVKRHVVLVILPGGGGHLDLDEQGCPNNMQGNSLVRTLPLFHKAGFSTVLVDAPSNYQDDEGLGGFRIKEEHAQDIGKIIEEVRKRTAAQVWLVGTSRGTISAVNAASRLKGASLPDGLVLTSPVTSGDSFAKNPWVAHTVFSLDLELIRLPVLVMAHEDDKCIRTPPGKIKQIIETTEGVREKSVTMTGGPGWKGGQSVRACKGRAPHGYVEQENEMVNEISQFIYL